jgi:predicted RNA-binding protein with PIN domain
VTRISANRDPLVGVTRLLVDGTNLLHALARVNAYGPGDGSGSTARLPPAALVGRLRALIPPETSIEIVFDGPPEPGLKNERIAHGVSVRYGGRHTADTILVTLVEEVAMAAGARPGQAAPATDAILVVSDDRDLRFAVGRRGARTAGAQWLIRRLERPRLSAPSIGNRRPPMPPQVDQPRPGAARRSRGPRR